MSELDITGKIGALYPATHEIEWPMYSFSRPSHIVWNAIANGLKAKGWSENRIKEWLQSKNARWALDGDLGDALAKLGKLYAARIKDAKNA